MDQIDKDIADAARTKKAILNVGLVIAVGYQIVDPLHHLINSNSIANAVVCGCAVLGALAVVRWEEEWRAARKSKHSKRKG